MSFYVTGRCEHCGGVLNRSDAPLTRKQWALYRFVAQQIETLGYAPSFVEIAAQFSYDSLSTVHEHLTNLERKGWIKRRYNEARAIECLVPLNDSAPVRVGSDET